MPKEAQFIADLKSHGYHATRTSVRAVKKEAGVKPRKRRKLDPPKEDSTYTRAEFEEFNIIEDTIYSDATMPEAMSSQVSAKVTTSQRNVSDYIKLRYNKVYQRHWLAREIESNSLLPD